uniref:NADH dehydrogenase subunit 6 n=1 Tax=Demodex folliculorum TaxID=481310 RepID=A0A0A7DUD0_DEMFO|nr:NADH dehydrogenase subunit 6 [Demodex folliculorum]AIW82504.1 NADH dehydrogenase subunit 6 [Demodex folliculorum]
MITFSKMKPSNLTFLLLVTTISMNIYMNIQSTNKWFPLILTLLFSGGILILFSFFSAIFSDKETPFMNLTPLWIISIAIMVLTSKKSPFLINDSSLILSYSSESINLMFISSFLLMFTLNIKHKTIKIGTALKSTKP